jgi:RimJ/RimL family protein N-acetyltransferase
MTEQKPIIFRAGRQTILRLLRKSTDLEACLRWINDPEVTPFLKSFLPVTEKSEEEWFDSIGKSQTNIVLGIETLSDHVFIGIMSLNRINFKDGVATTGAVIGEKEYWGKGYGKDAKMTLLDYAFNVLNLRKICSSAKAFNERSLRYNLRCGYHKEGCRPAQFFFNGQYWDEIFLAVFRDDWLPLWKEYQKTGKLS